MNMSSARVVLTGITSEKASVLGGAIGGIDHCTHSPTDNGLPGMLQSDGRAFK